MRACLVILCACVPDIPDPPAANTAGLQISETRVVELRYLRFDVSNYTKSFTKADILALPQAVRDRLWLLDLDVTDLLDNSLATIKALDPTTLTPAARNLQSLLRMTPDTANLAGTRFAPTLDLAPLFGIAPARVLGDLLGIAIDEEFLAADAVAQSLLRNVIRSHPNAQTRLGPKTAANPMGVYPVTPGRLPVTLADAASDFQTLSERFGVHPLHPGFITGETRAKILEDDFAMTVRVNANALPFKGVDMDVAARASVNPIPSQIERLFDFNDPNWLTFTGLKAGSPVIEALTFRVVEAPTFVRGGSSPIPASYGDSPAWLLPSYMFESLVVDSVRSTYRHRSASVAYDDLVSATVADGWLSIEVAGDVGQPPPPSYLWDVLLECAQVRLHDGGLAEGEATMEVPLTNIPVGIDSSVIAQTIADNLRADPAALLEVAVDIIDSTEGAADFYYAQDNDEDFLYFVAPDDMKDRAYAYAVTGFFADEALAAKLSTSDGKHDRVRVSAGDAVFAMDDGGRVFRIDVGAKPSAQRLALSVTRLR